MTTIDMMQAGIGRWMVARTERRARTRRLNKAPGLRLVRAVLQVVGLGWLDYAAWDISRTAGYVAIGVTFILVSAMITGNGGNGGGEGR